MGNVADDLAMAAQLPDGDVIRMLLEQHARIRTLFAEVRATDGPAKTEVFAELRALLAVHETAEQLVLRPVSEELTGKELAAARIHEEVEATKMLAELERLAVDSPDFAQKLAVFEKAVSDHAETEERDEFPVIVAGCTDERRAAMGLRLRATEAIAPTHPHPSVAGSRLGTLASAPLTAIVDRTRDAIRRAS